MKQKLLSIGAEAVLLLEKTKSQKKEQDKVIKKRLKKSYRIKEIDERLRSSRTKREVKVLEKLHDLGFVPRVLATDNQNTIEIEYLDGKRLSECLEQEQYETLGQEIGKKIKQVHDRGIIHGDLTTSNMILKDNKIYFIDFGLSFFSEKVEDKAVDIHVLEEALESRHHTVSKNVFAAVKKAYHDAGVLKRLEQVEMRGRNKGV